MENEGRKDDTGKPEWHLLPFKQVQDIVAVMTHGRKKYSAENWKKVPQARDRYFSAALRHLTAWRSGEILDPESNLPHLAHAGCCLLFLAWFDDRPPATSEKDKPTLTCDCGGTIMPAFKTPDGGRSYECNKCKKSFHIIKGELTEWLSSIS